MPETHFWGVLLQPLPISDGMVGSPERIDLDNAKAEKETHRDEDCATESSEPATATAAQLPLFSCEVSRRGTKAAPVSVSCSPVVVLKQSCLVGPSCFAGAGNARQYPERQKMLCLQRSVLATLLKLANKRRPHLEPTKRRLNRVRLARITKPIEYFGGRAELQWLFRSFFKTCIALRDYGIEHRNISLENLAIASRRTPFGKGTITSYDDMRDSARQLRPRYIYTMPSKTSLSDLVNNPKRHNSLESLLLCLIWIVTTRSGANNQKREDDFRYSFRSTELYRWHKRDGYGSDSGREQAKRRESVMKDQMKFENTIMNSVHPHFIKVKDFIRTLRALVYDPQWDETRNAIGDPDSVFYNERCALIKTYVSIIEDASWRDCTALDRARVVKPARSDKNTVIESYNTPNFPEVKKLLKKGLNEERLKAVKNLLGFT